MAKIFVSYSRKDSKAAHKLVDSLEEMGHDVWVDWEEISPAVDWLEKIKHGIEGSDAFVFLVSPDSIKSEVCNVEIGHAALNNKRIVPVMLRKVDISETNEVIQKFNFVFLRRGDNFENGIAQIKEAIEVDFEWVDEHNRLQTRALEWDRKKDTSLLLSGRELRRVRRLVRKVAGKEPLPTDLQALYIKHAIQTEVRRRVLIIVSTITLILMVGLFLFANVQRIRANENAAIADTNRADAEAQAVIARQNELEADSQRQVADEQRVIAEEQQKIAEDQKLIAQAQRSAARAQIYQIQPDELYTSTLLAIASWKTSPSDEANEILRKNISLLPIPNKPIQREGNINSLEFNTEGDLYVTGGDDGKACVWKASDGEMVYCWSSPKSVNDAAFSSDGKFMVTGDSSGEVQVIRTSDWEEQSTFNAETIVWDIDIRRDGEEIAVTRDDGRISIIDLETGEEKYPLFVTGKVRIASFSPNGYYVAAGSSTGVVTLWNLEAGGAPITSGRHTGEVFALAFSPDSRYLITGGEDGYAVTARTSNGQALYRLLHEDSVRNVAISPDGTWFATASNDHRIRLWDITDGDERLRMSQDNFVQAVKISASGQWLATTGADNTVRVWNASTGAQMFQIPLKHEGQVLDFSSDGKYLAAGDAGGTINVWDISLMPIPENSLQFDDSIGDVKFSLSGDWIAVSEGPRVWLLKPEQLSTLTINDLGDPDITTTGNVSNLAFSPDSIWLGILTDGGEVRVYHLVNRTMRIFSAAGTTQDIAFSSDSVQLLTSQPGGSVDGWDLTTREQSVSFAGGVQDVTSFAVSPSNIAMGVTDSIEIANNDGEMVSELESPGDHSLLVFNEDGSMLASSNSAGFIEIWALSAGVFNHVGSIQKESVLSMAFNPSSTQLAVGTTSTVYLIDPSTVKEIARIPHAGRVNGVSYSSDGNMLATASLKALQLWDVTKIQPVYADDLVNAACSRMVANFSEAQWSNLFQDEPYQLLCENLPDPRE